MALILVIEDEAPIRDNLCRLLRLDGHTVWAEADGQAGLDRLLQVPETAPWPDLILCDLMMPVLDGFGVLAALLRPLVAKRRPPPLVFLSASAEPHTLEEGLLRGAQAYVTKPFSWPVLRAQIERLLKAAP